MIRCPRCDADNRNVARFCGHCGISLEAGPDGQRRAGALRAPDAISPPAGYTPILGAAHLYFRTESSMGGATLIDTEGLRLTVFNAGYALRDVRLHVSGDGHDGSAILSHDIELETFSRGEKIACEIPSYLVPSPLGALRVALAEAAFAPHTAAPGSSKGANP